jgi:hypothetical protein
MTVTVKQEDFLSHRPKLFEKGGTSKFVHRCENRGRRDERDSVAGRRRRGEKFLS